MYACHPNTARIVHALRSVVGDSPSVALHQPELEGNARRYVDEAIAANWVSSAGPFGNRFETALAQYTGVRHAVVVVNGTAALHVALVLSGVQPGDEVLVPAFSFVATANAVSYCGAVPHFVDITPRTLGLCPDALREHLTTTGERRTDGTYNRTTGRRIAAITPMHAFGHPADLPALAALAAEWRLPLVEDAAEALGSRLDDKHVGNTGLLAALSFNGNKIITTGGGGAILTNDAVLAERARHLTTTAKLSHPWEYVHDAIGFNYRMPDLNAALGLAQLERIDSFVARKRALADRYRAALSDLPGIHFFNEPGNAHSNYWLNLLLLDQPDVVARDRLLGACHQAGLLVRPAWAPLSQLPMYRACPCAPLPATEAMAASVVCLPSSPGLVA